MARKIPLRVVAEEAGTSITAISRLERGRRPMPAEKLARVVDAVGADPAVVFRLAGALPPVAAEEMLGQDLARALQGSGLSPAARTALRREHLAELTSELVGGVNTPPVDVEAVLFKKLGVDYEPESEARWHFHSPSEIRYPAADDDLDRASEKRLRLAHMAGHIVLSRDSGRAPVCSPGRADEAEATYVAGLILMPRDLLRAEFQFIAIPSYDIDTPDGFGGLIADIAGRFAVPLWLAAGRAAETGLLAWTAGWEER
jgi:transcriptional regulator with XRE-family HTH domain